MPIPTSGSVPAATAQSVRFAGQICARVLSRFNPVSVRCCLDAGPRLVRFARHPMLRSKPHSGFEENHCPSTTLVPPACSMRSVKTAPRG